MQKKSIFFILPWLPYPMITGGHQALFNGIMAVKEDFDVHIAYGVGEGEEDNESVKGFLEEVPGAHLYPLLYPVPHTSVLKSIKSRIKKIIRCVLGIKAKVAIVDSFESVVAKWKSSVSPMGKLWLEHIDAICKKNDFDIIQVEMPPMLSQILTLPEKPKKIYVHHELGFVRRNLEIRNMPDSPYYKACKRFADINEIALLNMYDAVVSLSPVDTKKLVDAGVRVPVFSSFAVVNTPLEIKISVGDGKRLTFIGPDMHIPNLVGITWFLENCWDKLKKMDSAYCLNIIGKWSDKNIKEIAERYPDVHFLGFVEDLGLALQGSVMIVPITIGSGIRMKILEASARGIPFVSTVVGAEGIPVENGVNCFIADDADGFVQSIVRLQDKKLQERFALTAKKSVLQQYSLESLKSNRLKIYGELGIGGSL